MPNQPATAQRSVRVAEALWTAAQNKAARENTTISAVIVKALTDFVATPVMTRIATDAWNSDTESWECIEIENGTREDFDLAELSADDLGCQVGDTFRLRLIDNDGATITEKEIVAA